MANSSRHISSRPGAVLISNNGLPRFGYIGNRSGGEWSLPKTDTVARWRRITQRHLVLNARGAGGGAESPSAVLRISRNQGAPRSPFYDVVPHGNWRSPLRRSPRAIQPIVPCEKSDAVRPPRCLHPRFRSREMKIFSTASSFSSIYESCRPLLKTGPKNS